MCVQLHVRSSYSLLQSTLTIPKIIEACKYYGYSAIALCDNKVMHGAREFYKLCKQNNIKAIYGLQMKVKVDDKQVQLLLYAKNDIGYQALLKLSTYLTTHDELLDYEDLALYTSSLIVVIYSMDCDIEELLSKDDMIVIQQILEKLKRAYSNLYGGICNNDNGLLKKANVPYRRLLKQLNIKTVAISSIYYLHKQDELAYQCLCAIDQEVLINDKKINVAYNRYFYSKELMNQLYEQEDLLNTIEIMNMCNVEMKLKKANLPIFKNKYQMNSKDFLTQLCLKGLQKRLNSNVLPNHYVNRLRYELDIILKMHFEDYFLIVYDYIRYAKSKEIYVGCGRGSAAGSLVAYCLGITNVDPIQYDLLFERFLNPERISMPDIDVDFPDNRRDEVIDYVYQTYGQERVAHILTFNTLGAKAVLRDVGRVLNVPSRQVDVLCKLVGNKPKTTLKETYLTQSNFKNMIDHNRELQKLFQIALQLEGLPRHYSLHAAGIILSQEAISDICPLMKVDSELFVSQFTMEHLEELGLIKFDFLGLRNLTIIDEILQQLKKDHIHFDLNKLTYQDPKTFQLLKNVDTLGVFQLESDGIKALIHKMQPNCFEDIVATIALFRPGPMENIPEYLKRRNDPSLIDTIHPDLKPILYKTYGIMIYQEQILQIAQVMANFSLGKADILRKAISKKNEAELQKLSNDFIEGAMKKGYDRKVATYVYQLILKFANYGFNRSHSVAYAMIAYQMAYLKTNAPLYFYCALLNSVIGSESKTSEYIFEIRKRGIKVLPPSINYAIDIYKIENNAIRFPFTAIKGIKKMVAQQILQERHKHGQFIDFYDFIARVSGVKVSKNHIESLINAGACDDFRMNRASLLANIDNALMFATLARVKKGDDITYDDSLVSKQAMIMVNENSFVRSEKEKEALGFYLSIHPITQLRQQYQISLCLLQLPHYLNQYVRFVCLVQKVKQHRTKTSALMAFVSVNDETATFDLVFMPQVYEQYQKYLEKGNYLLIEGKIDKETSCLVRKVERIQL